MTGAPNDGSRDRGIGPEGTGPIVSEARWHMAGAVLAAMFLTLLLPSDLRLGPRLLLPIMEGALLVALIKATISLPVLGLVVARAVNVLT